MTYAVMCRSVTVVNTDPQRRCYWGVNYSERTDYGPWELFQEFDDEEHAKRVARIFACGRWQYKVVVK